METSYPRKFWPYDEITLTRGQNPSQFIVQSPWIKTTVELDSDQVDRAARIVEKMNQQSLAAEDMEDVSWFFSALSAYPISYILPSPHVVPHADIHQRLNSNDLSQTPRESFLLIGEALNKSDIFKVVAQEQVFSGNWKWDFESALLMSQTPSGGYDPQTLFSIARRFHLLDSLESNKTDEMSEFVQNLSKDKEAFTQASALVVRQNHYVTQTCDAALRPALKLAQKADAEVLDFIQAEAGHDAILGRALKAMNLQPEDIPVIEPILVLMSLFQYVASHNFLAFAMVVDMFERSSYQDHDPLAELLTTGGHDEAAKQIDVHKKINDEGEHENVALGFLNCMGPVDADYAREAFEWAELVTNTIHTVSSGLLKRIKNTSHIRYANSDSK